MADKLFEFTEESQWEKLVENSAVPIVVEFCTPWCEPCKELEPVLKRLSQEFQNVSFYRYNMDVLFFRADEFGVTGVPTTMLFKPGVYRGSPPLVVDTILGYVTADMLRTKIQALVEEPISA